MTTEYLLGVAVQWLTLGFQVLPLQPGTKHLMRGWGINLRRIKTADEVQKYLRHGNMAVICQGDNFVLDFDDWNLYRSWAKYADERYTTSYTEYTPRGAHVWLRGDVIAGMRLRAGVEVKRVAVVYPSVVDGVEYLAGSGQIFAGDVDDAFFGLTMPGTPTAYKLRTDAINQKIAQDQAYKQPQKKIPAANLKPSITLDKVTLVKRSVRVVDLFQAISPTAQTLRGDGRWRQACCPFHQDDSPSFWIDDERNLWGCHSSACGAHGDVINLYSRINGLSVGDAIRALAVEVAQ